MQGKVIFMVLNCLILSSCISLKKQDASIKEQAENENYDYRTGSKLSPRPYPPSEKTPKTKEDKWQVEIGK